MTTEQAAKAAAARVQVVEARAEAAQARARAETARAEAISAWEARAETFSARAEGVDHVLTPNIEDCTQTSGDFDSLQDHAVTIRNRDTTQQERDRK